MTKSINKALKIAIPSLTSNMIGQMAQNIQLLKGRTIDDARFQCVDFYEDSIVVSYMRGQEVKTKRVANIRVPRNLVGNMFLVIESKVKILER